MFISSLWVIVVSRATLFITSLVHSQSSLLKPTEHQRVLFEYESDSSCRDLMREARAGYRHMLHGTDNRTS